MILLLMMKFMITLDSKVHVLEAWQMLELYPEVLDQLF